MFRRKQMNKLFILLALITSPVYAQEPVKETTEEINYYERDFPMSVGQPKTEQMLRIERAYNRSIAASDNYAKVRAQRKETVPVIRVEGTIVVQVRVDDGTYRPVCPYNNCR
jgi:hypothetical protein